MTPNFYISEVPGPHVSLKQGSGFVLVCLDNIAVLWFGTDGKVHRMLLTEDDEKALKAKGVKFDRQSRIRLGD